MSSVSEILQSFEPVLKNVKSRANKNQITPLDIRIESLVRKLKDVQTSQGSCTLDNFKVVNVHLSHLLTLADLQTSFESCPQVANHIISYLNIQQNFDKLNALFSTIERIKSVSERILSHVSLFDVQIAGFVIPLESSPVWFALSSDERF